MTRKRYCPLCKMDACPEGTSAASEATLLLRSQPEPPATATTPVSSSGPADLRQPLSLNSADDEHQAVPLTEHGAVATDGPGAHRDGETRIRVATDDGPS
eukprot:Unigene2479_Nuclearia_a/m.7667 Unigene2479_Nuclearia_a/g.7667  ORF Unigene2479_Nuclearia_a/g.7667 Unigene2479_Nuclearia_a/m.7667 type:complete len:100 (+) Unigene2479_Nuclearia_a:924-1223(+)